MGARASSRCSFTHFSTLPIIVVVLYSFSATKVNAWPIQGYTLDWYRELRADTEIRNAIGLSVRLGLVAAFASLVLGTLGALALDRYRFPGKPAIRFLIVLPITLPGIVTGIALLAFFSLTDKPLAQWTIHLFGLSFPIPLIVAHITFSITLVLSTVAARLFQLPPSLGEASADLGATPWRTFRKVTLPLDLSRHALWGDPCVHAFVRRGGGLALSQRTRQHAAPADLGALATRTLAGDQCRGDHHHCWYR